MTKAPKPAPAGQAGSRMTAAAATARVLVGLVFILAGFEKAVAPPEELAAVMEAYAILPEGWLIPVARVMPWAELILGVFLAAGYKVRFAAAALTAFLGAFVLGLASALARGLELDSCGCFGAGLSLKPPVALAVDCALAALGVLAWRRGRDLCSLDRWVDAGS